MEKQGQNGHLSFIDGSPDYVRKANENLYAKGNLTDDDTLQDFVCITVAKALASEWSNDDVSNFLVIFFKQPSLPRRTNTRSR